MPYYDHEHIPGKRTKNSHFQVKNLRGTTSHGAETLKCNCKSWIQHWREATGSKRKTCCVLDCTKKDLVGGHIQIKDGRLSDHWYIAPICNSHNNFRNDALMFIGVRTELVPADVRFNCREWREEKSG